MSSELDLPLMPSAEQIRRREFATVRRGYDPDQVREYLGQIAAQVETLEKRLRDTKMQADTRGSMTTGEVLAGRMATELGGSGAPAPTPEPPVPVASDDAYARLTARFGRMIESADKEATAVVDEAKADATRILEVARSEADRVRVDAQARAEEARQVGSEELAKAKEEADRILGTLATRRESLVAQMQEMQTRLLSVAKDLESAMEERDDDASPSTAPVERERSTEEPAREEPIDPRYEDLWSSGAGGSGSPSSSKGDDTIDLPDLAPIDLDFDDEKRSQD
jgi:DivIVA domain-containing protein